MAALVGEAFGWSTLRLPVAVGDSVGEPDPGGEVPFGLTAALAGPPTPETVAFLAELDPNDVDPAARVNLIQAWDRVASWVSAQQQVALAAVAAATAALGRPGDEARHEVGTALRLSPVTAYTRARDAQELTGRLHRTWAALAAGAITCLQASALADAVADLSDDVARAIEDRVLAKATELTVAETRRLIRRAVIAADPRGVAERAVEARAERGVHRWALPDGMAELRAVLTAPDAARIWAQLSTDARAEHSRRAAAGTPSPGLDALRADALVARTVHSETPDHGPGRPEPVSVGVWLDLPTLLGLAEHPGELAGYGPIPAPLARELAADGAWTRWLTDPQSGELLDVGRHTYRPSPRLAQFVKSRDQVCGWPGCNQPAARCDCDHVQDFDRGGETTRANLGPLCRQHHNAKTHGRWRLTRDSDGICHWTSPLGKHYTKRLTRHPPDP